MSYEPDRRTMNHMDADTKLVHVRLEEWARLCADRLRAWPARTALGTAIDIAKGAYTARGIETLPEHVLRVDNAVAKLGDIDRRVVITYYTRQEPVEALSRRMSMRHRQFQIVLKRARWRIGGYLAAMET